MDSETEPGVFVQPVDGEGAVARHEQDTPEIARPLAARGAWRREVPLEGRGPFLEADDRPIVVTSTTG